MTFRRLRPVSPRRSLSDESGQSMIEMAMMHAALRDACAWRDRIELRAARPARRHEDVARRVQPHLARRFDPVSPTQALAIDENRQRRFRDRLRRSSSPSSSIPHDRGRTTTPTSWTSVTRTARRVGGGSAITCGACSGNLGGSARLLGGRTRTTTPRCESPAAFRPIRSRPAGMLYITEIYSSHPLITPFDRFGISVPTSLYSIAYF